ncbi:MAG: methionyl-tRNA formyltransferase [Arcobacteraceae bacterium]|nr:methionyl-tRNA formyltransferase [Arcobacteraceae bacterium]MDY0364775.1 methionyl-tRNA formyltransferase [Arcobacteraceae bacterium]
MKKIIFMGTPSYATIILDKLIRNRYEIVALFTQPDKPVGRKQTLTPPDIKQYAIDNKLDFPIYQPHRLNEVENIDIIKKLNPDYIIVAAYGQILPKEILDIAPCINLHASLLPLYRGASPIQEALLNNDTFTGVTAMLMDEGLDSGDILGYQYIKLSQNCDVIKLFDRLSIVAANLTIKILDNFDLIQPTKQKQHLVSYCKKIKKSDGIVELDDAQTIVSKYKAYKFWPNIALENGLKLKELRLGDKDKYYEKGKILQILPDSIEVACLKGSIFIKSLQAPSKKELNAVEYIKGKRLNLGDYLS